VQGGGSRVNPAWAVVQSVLGMSAAYTFGAAKGYGSDSCLALAGAGFLAAVGGQP